MYDHQKSAGRGLGLQEVYQYIFGSGPSAKAFRSLVKHMGDKWYPSPDVAPPEIQALSVQAGPTLRAIRTSQEFKSLMSKYREYLGFPGMDKGDPIIFAAMLGPSGLRNLKKFLDSQLKGKVQKISGRTREFLLEWVNTNVSHMGRPDQDMVNELEPYRPDGVQLLYRGIRFSDVGELVEFTESYVGTGKPFPFLSSRFTSWTKSPDIATKFARYTAYTSHNEAMFGWLRQMKSGKGYSGFGGYVIGARVKPDQCFVDMEKTGISGQHGNEEEVIVLANQTLVCKVYKVFGDVLQEVEDFKSSNSEEKPEEFLRSVGIWTRLVGVEGNTATFRFDPSPRYDGSKPEGTPKSESGDAIIERFRANLYSSRWINDYQVQFEPMNLPSRVAHIWSRRKR
jgi:hypothetical protein